MSGARILVVEDNVINRRLVRDILEYRGHEVIEASTVHEGLSLIHGHTPDLVVLDIQIPGGGGEALLKEIRQDPQLSGLPVVAVTALAMRGDKERLLRAGFDRYISKPIDTRAFGPTLEACLDGRGKHHGA